MKEDHLKMLTMKQEARLAVEAFKAKHGKVSKGINQIYFNILLSNNQKEIEAEYGRLFGYIQKSKKAKEKWRNLTWEKMKRRDP